MRVLHIIDTLKGGGAEAALCDLLPRLSTRGITTAVIAGSESRLSSLEKEQLNCEVIEGGKAGKMDVTYGVRLTRLIRRQRPDIVHTHTFHGKYWGRICALAAHVAVIVHTEHSSVARIPPHEWLLARRLVGRTRAYITFSERTRMLISTREPVPEVVVIPNGICIPQLPAPHERATARAALGAAPDDHLVGMVASLLPNKNHRLALDGLARLPEPLRARTFLHIFGSGPLEDELRDRALRAGVAGSVRFHGFRSDVRHLLPALDLVLNLSLAESAPISLLEAMSMALPIIGAPNIGVLDLIENDRSGMVLPDYRPDTLAGALSRALSEPGWRARAGVNGRATVAARHDVERTTDLHVDMYRRFLAA